MKIRLTIAVLLVATAPVACAGVQWPTIRDTSGSKHFTEAKSAALTTTIYSPQGAALYTLECHSGEYEGDRQFDYSGLFHCRLRSKSSTDLLASLLFESSHPTSDWEGRARFLLGEVLGDCAKVPDWGAVRHFHLRHMDIRLSVTDVSMNKRDHQVEVGSFTFSYDIRQDPAAGTSLVAPSTVPEPAWFGSEKACWPK